MADREQNLHKIIKFLKEFKTEVELRNSINLYDINIHAEYFYRDLFNLVYGLGLKNLNAQTTNAAYIDLVDAENKIAIQVTSQNDNAKIKGAIEGFFANSANKDFRLIVLLIAKKAKDYKTDFTESGKYNFNHKEDVVDIERLLVEIADKTDDEIKVIAEFLVKDNIVFTLIPKFVPSDFPAQNIYFTGRETVLKNIADALRDHYTAAIADTHGVGKSSVINEFAYLNESVYKHIIFLRASKGEFDISVSKILVGLKVNLPNDAKPEQRLSAFQSWLAENDNWLLLVDNVDNVGEVFDCQFNKPNGKVIYTANDSQIYIVGRKVDLPKMSEIMRWFCFINIGRMNRTQR